MNIAALISGGVDSAVVVHLLCEQGYKPDLFYTSNPQLRAYMIQKRK